MDWNGMERKRVSLLNGLSYFVLFTDRCSYAITGSHPHFILSTPKNSSPKTANRYIRISFEYLLELQSDSLIYKSLQFISFEYLLELRYNRISPPLYSVDTQKKQPKNSKSLHTNFLWISFRITIGFVNLQIVTIYFLRISFRITIGVVNLFPLYIF